VANNNTYEGTTLTLSIKDTSYDNIIYQPTKPVLDSELNFMTDISSAKLQDFVRSKIPSGWLDASFTKGSDNSGNSFGINTTNEPNSFIVSSTKQTPLLANVNGWLLNIGGTGLTQDNKIKITLPDAPSASSRSDLVFLEVWKVALDGDSEEGKPGLNTLYKFGNTQYSGVNLLDQIINPSMNFRTTKRVQIQYRIRVVQGPDFLTTPEGVNDANTVNAQGANSSVLTNYPFVNAGSSWDDYGLYISGNGSSAARQDLGTVDGYVYAIPMFKIHRRNKGAYSTANQNGAAFSLSSNQISERPDELFHDQISVGDIEDLRHLVSFCNFNYQEILDKTVDEIYSGDYSQILSRSLLEGNFESSNQAIYINRIATSSVPNTDLLRSPAVPQRYFSDVPSEVIMSAARTVNNKTVGTPGANWTITEQISIAAPSTVSRASSVISSSNLPKVMFSQTSSGPFLEVVGTWSGLGTSNATFTLGSNPPALSNQILYITYHLSYARVGDKLTKPIKQMLRVQDNKRNENWGYISVNDFDSSVISNQYRKKRSIVPRSVSLNNPDYAYTYRLNPNFNFEGISTLYSYHVNATGTTNQFTIPANVINSNDAGYVYSVFNVNTQSFIYITGVFKNTDGSLNVTLQTSPNAVIRFDVALIGGVLEIDERTQSIVDLGRVDFYKINGNGTSQIVLKGTSLGLDPTDIIRGTQTCYGYQGLFNVETTCYVDGNLRRATVLREPNSSLIRLSFDNNISVSSVIEVALMTTEMLDSTDDLNIYYSYSEYKGITSKVNFGNSSNSFIETKVLCHRNKLDILTNGTGALNTSEFLPKRYEPLIPKLPIINSAEYGNFTSTIHKSKEIYGGSYSANTDFNSPYASGKNNFLSKNSISQNKGTFGGGRFISATEDSDSSVSKLIVGNLLEMVTNDGTNNFLPGEIAVKVETNYLVNTPSNKITNSTISGENSNSFDLYKVEGRPLIKLNSK